MYWSWLQSTGAEMRKYFTELRLANAARLVDVERSAKHTVVDLLEGDDRVLGQALLGVLVEQEGLWGDRALLSGGRGHGRVLVVGIHIGGDSEASGARPASQGEGSCARGLETKRVVSISNTGRNGSGAQREMEVVEVKQPATTARSRRQGGAGRWKRTGTRALLRVGCGRGPASGCKEKQN